MPKKIRHLHKVKINGEYQELDTTELSEIKGCVLSPSQICMRIGNLKKKKYIKAEDLPELIYTNLFSKTVIPKGGLRQEKLKDAYLILNTNGEITNLKINSLPARKQCKCESIREIRKIFNEIDEMDLPEKKKAELRGESIFHFEDEETGMPAPTEFTKTICEHWKAPTEKYESVSYGMVQ